MLPWFNVLSGILGCNKCRRENKCADFLDKMKAGYNLHHDISTFEK